MAAAVAPANGASTPLPILSIAGGGGATWTTIDNTVECTSAPVGFNISDATLGALSDAYDNAFCMFVGSDIYTGPSTVDLTGGTVTSGPTLMSGLATTYQYTFLSTRAAVRVLASFTNPGNSPVNVPVSFETNLGSDGASVTPLSSSGDAAMSSADRWAVTNGDADPSLAHVFAGPGNPATLPSVATDATIGPGCTAATTPGSWCVTYNLTVPPGATRRLMLVDELATDGPSAGAAAQLYGSLATLPTELLADLAPNALREIVNWDLFGATSIAPTAVARGVATPVTLTGRALSAGVTVDMGPDVTTGPVTVTSPTTATFVATASPTAALGARNVTIGLNGATSTCSACYFVTTPAGPPLLASVKLLQPKSRAGFSNALLLSLSERAVVKVVVEQLVPGRKKAGKCSIVATTGPRCTKTVLRGTLTGTQEPGASIGVVIPAKIGGKSLKAGTYRLTVTATDPEGNVSLPKTVKFTITK